MQAHTNEELCRVQLGTGEIRLMTLDALDHAFNEGIVDARVPVLPPGASAWTTLGEAAGLEEEAPRPQDTPSLSPVAISAPSVPPSALDAQSSSLDLDLPDTFEELRPRRRGLIFGGVAAAAAAGLMLAVVAARLGSSMPTTGDIKAAAAVQAPAAAVESIPSKEEPKPEVKTESGGKAELSDWQKRMLVDADKAREAKTKAKSAEKASKAPPAKPKAKSGGLLNGGDRFDPLNGAL
jgi:hypothetical protein